jgi:hypothetical protein
MSAHATVQEFINLGEELYGLVTNGRVLRLLRNSSRLIKLSFLEFDLERIFTENLFADFAILYRLLHATRLPKESENAAESLIELYHQESLDSGARIREGLSEAVEKTILLFGNALLNHPDNQVLRKAVDGGLSGRGFYQLLLRLIYRILFLMVIEERDLVYPPNADLKRRQIYQKYYSIQRLRKISENPWLANARQHDLWISLLATFHLFEAEGPGKKLDLYPLAGDLFSPKAIEPIQMCRIDNESFIKCMRFLNQYLHPDTRQAIRVNYGALNVEEFGSVYEGLLEFDAQITKESHRYEWRLNKGEERAQTGSHYTADILVQPLIRHTLEPLIERALKETNPKQALLNLRIADITCGTGHTLLAAARRVATVLASVRTGEEQPSPPAYRKALRDVICTCIYGVDINPLAVELCKVALWLEAHNPGMPLNFLDHHIKCGNAIVGFPREEDLKHVPDEAFQSLNGDDPERVRSLKRKNQQERNQPTLWGQTVQGALVSYREKWKSLSSLPERTPEEIEKKKSSFLEFTISEQAVQFRRMASIPIVQFFLPKTLEYEEAFTTDADFQKYRLENVPLCGRKAEITQKVMDDYQIFHWFLEFPEIMAKGGFDCILGNPPYLGGQRLSGRFGYPFCHYVKWMYAPTGLSELAVYFLRRVFVLLKNNGTTGLITTNSIKDGDVRRDGLEQIRTQEGAIIMALRSIRWPGRANLYVSVVGIHKGPWKEKRMLDNREVDFISPLFEDYEDLGNPLALLDNRDRIFQGSIFLGKGFLLTHEEAKRMIEDEPRNKEVIFPTINGEEINNVPDQSPQRSIINFHDWTERDSKQYKIPFRVVEEKVKPVRMELNETVPINKKRKNSWWLFGSSASSLYLSLRDRTRCFVAAVVTKYLNFSASPTSYVFSHKLFVFSTERWDLYSVVQSSIHEIWARKYSGGLALTLNYSPTDCFATFAFPPGIWHIPYPDLAKTGESYHEFRRSLMLDLWLGLTDLYNLFHDESLTPEKVGKKSKKPEKAQSGYEGILELRRLHTELDEAVLSAYGWSDIDLGHGFREIETLPENDRVRYAMTEEARKELLRRLLLLNLEQAKNQEKTSFRSQKKSNTPGLWGDNANNN